MKPKLYYTRKFRAIVNVAKGESTELECRVYGYPMPVISWEFKGKIVGKVGLTTYFKFIL